MIKPDREARIIKFRTWDKIDKKWQETFTIEEACWIGFGWDNTDHLIFSQFTGLLDKNGKEIYEGDIVQIRLMDEEESLFVLTEIVWHNYKWLARSIKGKGGQGNWTYKYFDNPKNTEVIGNIYENPELLKEKP